MKTVLHATWPAWAGVGASEVSKSWGPGGHIGHGPGWARSAGPDGSYASIGPDGEVVGTAGPFVARVATPPGSS